MRSSLGLLVLLAAGVSSHVSISPNTGVGSGWMVATLSIPHGTDGYDTTKLEVFIPAGIERLKPMYHAGWKSEVTMKAIPPQNNHGTIVSEAPDMLVLTAQTGHGLPHENIMQFSFQMKIGCIFDDAASNTMWNDKYTLWFRVNQTVSEIGQHHPNHTLEWTGVVKDAESLNSAMPKPSPYITLTSWEKCHDHDTGALGMLWFGSRVKSPAVEPEKELSEARVIELVKQHTMSKEEATVLIEKMKKNQPKAGGNGDFETYHEVFIWLGFILTLINTFAVLAVVAKVFLMPAAPSTVNSPDAK